MHRREFLATLGATAVAGCAGEPASSESQPSTAPPTAPETTAEPTTVERSTVSRTARPTDRPEPTSSRAAELIEMGRGHLRAAIAAFVEHAGGPDRTIVDVTAATTEFSRFDVNDEYRSAKGRLEDAREIGGPTQRVLAEDLLEVAEFVNTLGFAQTHLVNAYGAVSEAMRSIYTENYSDISDATGDARRQRISAEGYVTRIRESFEPETFDVVESISGEQYEAKVAQLARELVAFDGIATQIAALENPLVRFEENVQHYVTRQYEEVIFETREFEEVHAALGAIKPSASLSPVLDELTCVVGALLEGSDVMRDALLERQNGDAQTARALESEAEGDFRACEKLVEEVKPVSDLVDTIPR